MLPNDVVLLILHACARLRADHATNVQRMWRGYRTRVLLGRFRLLRYLREFREWNPDPATFLDRAKL